MKNTLAVASLLALAGGLAITVIVAHAAGENQPPEIAVKIEKFLYNPNPVIVPVGATVHWTNKDVVPHNVVSEDKSFKSKLMAKDEEFSYKFTRPGTFNYVCSIHPRMVAKVIVQQPEKP